MASGLFGLAGKLVGELCSSLFKEYVAQPWLHGSKDEFEKLEDTMVSMEAVLLDAEDRQETSHQIQLWLRKIKLVLYDVEDLLQEVTNEGLKRQVKQNKRKRTGKVLLPFSSPNTFNFRLEMGGKVKLIRERLDAISLDSERFNFIERQSDLSALRSKKREETHSFVPVDKFIGREEDKKYVTKLLVEPDVVDNVSVISVVGIGGLGKTTLVQSIYHSREVKENFDLTMWVCVSDPFDVKLICENIIESATKEKCERPRLDGVKDELKKAIDRRKYLLVLDDVWNDKHIKWLELEVLLRGGARGSKILITTRSQLVARAAKSIATHVLKGLSREDSWDLFKQVAFTRGVEQVSPIIEGIGKEVIEKCDGVPLVIKAIGGLLAVKEGENDWLDFKNNDLARVTQDSEGSVLPSLRLSYDYLSPPLKRCFVYCAIYPKDYEIKKKDLIGMWVAHGLIQLDRTTRSLEDVGERYFMDLLDRSFFEVHWRKTYKMHDLIHDLALSVGGDEYYNPGSGANYIDKSTRHSWTRHSRVTGDELTNLCHGQKLRTLVVTKSRDTNQVHEVVSTFEQLRVLSLENSELEWVPQFFVRLRHLNYLDLSRNSFVSLPASICSLYNLQTLILYRCEKLEDLPAGTRDLVSLRRLDIKYCYKLRQMPRGLEELTCLHTLKKFITAGKREEDERNCAEVCELKSLVNLRGSLEITNLRASKCAKCKRNKSCILIDLKLITKLKLSWKYWPEDIKQAKEDKAELLLFESLKPHPNLERLIVENYLGRKFPSWMDRVCLPNIVYIKLENCESWRHLPPLGLLPSLQELHLEWMDRMEYLIDSSTTLEETDQILFPSLKELYLRGMSELKRLSFEDTDTLPSGLQYLPRLQTLELYYCPELVSLPEWMGNLTSLEELHLEKLISLESIPDCFQDLTSLHLLRIEDCPELESRCEEETGEDWHKIAHIPYFTLNEKES